MRPSKIGFYSSLFLFLFMFLNANPAAYAAANKGPVQKLARGFVHIIASPFQIPKEIIETTGETQDDLWIAPFRGMTEGTGKGLYMMIRQGFSGFADLFTFWTPAGRDWEPVFETESLFPQV